MHLLFHCCVVRDRSRRGSAADTEPKKTTKSACLQNADRRRRIIKSIYMISVFILMPRMSRWRGYTFFAGADHANNEIIKWTRQNNLQSATVSLQVVIGLQAQRNGGSDFSKPPLG